MQSSEMKLYVGFISPDKRNECACEDWERRNKKRAAIFLSCPYFDFKCSVERSFFQATETAQRNKANDCSLTA